MPLIAIMNPYGASFVLIVVPFGDPFPHNQNDWSATANKNSALVAT
jgi:hypothetical protein